MSFSSQCQCQAEPNSRVLEGTHLVQKAVSIRMSELSGHIASRGLNKDVDSNRRGNAGSSGQSPLQEHHFATRFEV